MRKNKFWWIMVLGLILIIGLDWLIVFIFNNPMYSENVQVVGLGLTFIITMVYIMSMIRLYTDKFASTNKDGK